MKPRTERTSEALGAAAGSAVAKATDDTRYRSLLHTLGLSDLEAGAFMHLLGDPRSAAELASALGAEHRRVAEALKRLVGMGLAKRFPGRVMRYRLVPPEVTLPPVLHRHQEQLGEYLKMTRDLQAIYGAAQPGLETETYVEVVVGVEAQRQQFEALQAQARREILGCTKPPLLLTSPEEGNPGEEIALARGVSNRWLYEAEILEMPGALEGIRSFAQRGEESRVSPRLPSKLFIFDRQAVLIHVTEQTVQGAEVATLIMRHPELVQTLHALFEFMWSQATPLFPSRAETPGQQAPSHEDLLQLLVSGLKDAAICRQLGISRRTLARRMREIFSGLEASSRFEAGYRLGLGAAHDEAEHESPEEALPPPR